MSDPEIGYQSDTLWDFASVLAQNAMDNAPVNEVLNLHTMSTTFDGCCDHCLDGDGSHSVTWPCPTVRTIANHYGIGEPK